MHQPRPGASRADVATRAETPSGGLRANRELTASRNSEGVANTASGIAAAITGVGELMMALFPFAIPILLLTAAFTAPLVILGVIVALPLAIVAGVVLAIRTIGRWLGAGRAARHQESAFGGAPSNVRAGMLS
jgi:hypothetical protein